MSEISIYEQGKGDTIILIHGFPMSAAVWEKFSSRLVSTFRVVTLDLPGFGNSPMLPTPFTVDDVADAVLEKIRSMGIGKMVVMGHSMGGYVTLAMVDRDPERFAGFGLIHSTAKADSAEKNQARDKALEFIKKNGARAYTTNYALSVFADSSHPDVPFVRELNIRAGEPALIAYTQAMRDRPDRTSLLANFSRPVLFIGGAKDSVIPSEDVREQAALTPNGSLHILENQAHMSLIEDVPTTSSLVYDFALRCYE